MGSEDANYLAFFFFFNSSTQRIPAPHTRPPPGSRLQEWGDVAWEAGGGAWGSVKTPLLPSCFCPCPSDVRLRYQNRKVVGWACR